MVSEMVVLPKEHFKYVTLALRLGSGWILVVLQEYCKCKFKRPQEALAEGSYDNEESVI